MMKSRRIDSYGAEETGANKSLLFPELKDIPNLSVVAVNLDDLSSKGLASLHVSKSFF